MISIVQLRCSNVHFKAYIHRSQQCPLINFYVCTVSSVPNIYTRQQIVTSGYITALDTLIISFNSLHISVVLQFGYLIFYSYALIFYFKTIYATGKFLCMLYLYMTDVMLSDCLYSSQIRY